MKLYCFCNILLIILSESETYRPPNIATTIYPIETSESHQPEEVFTENKICWVIIGIEHCVFLIISLTICIWRFRRKIWCLRRFRKFHSLSKWLLFFFYDLNIKVHVVDIVLLVLLRHLILCWIKFCKRYLKTYLFNCVNKRNLL